MTAIWRLLLCVFMVLAVFVAVRFFPGAQMTASLPNDAYIWQRKWTPGVTEAMHASADLVGTWHVLAAEYSQTSNAYHWVQAQPDWQTLVATRQPVVAVFRIDGQIKQWDDARFMANIAALLQTWHQHGVKPIGIEIDYDCGTARLAAYAQFLRALRRTLDQTTRLAITALPTWLDSADLDDLLASNDEAVLQLHAVMSPAQGLFDPDQAYRWVTQFARREHKPWRVALPSYGTRVIWNSEGRIVAIESEHAALYLRRQPAGAQSLGGNARELIATPTVIRDFLARIDREPPRGLSGIVWFRLPTATDARAWSLATWRAVLSRAELSEHIDILSRPAEAAGLYDVLLSNTGNVDAELPGAVRISGACSAADGINDYILAYDAQGMVLRRTQRGLLRAGTQFNIGWLRCDASRQNGIIFHVES